MAGGGASVGQEGHDQWGRKGRISRARDQWGRKGMISGAERAGSVGQDGDDQWGRRA